jgi:hypothetical protein
VRVRMRKEEDGKNEEGERGRDVVGEGEGGED